MLLLLLLMHHGVHGHETHIGLGVLHDRYRNIHDLGLRIGHLVRHVWPCMGCRERLLIGRCANIGVARRSTTETGVGDSSVRFCGFGRGFAMLSSRQRGEGFLSRSVRPVATMIRPGRGGNVPRAVSGGGRCPCDGLPTIPFLFPQDVPSSLSLDDPDSGLIPTFPRLHDVFPILGRQIGFGASSLVRRPSIERRSRGRRSPARLLLLRSNQRHGPCQAVWPGGRSQGFHLYRFLPRGDPAQRLSFLALAFLRLGFATLAIRSDSPVDRLLFTGGLCCGRRLRRRRLRRWELDGRDGSRHRWRSARPDRLWPAVLDLVLL